MLSGLVPIALGKPKSKFEAELDELIRNHLKLTEDALRDLTYRTGSGRAARVLLLMNVEAVRQRKHSTERYSFKEHASGRWSLEHIHAQNAQQLPRRIEVWETWLRLHRRALAAIESVGGEEKVQLLNRVDAVLENPPIKGRDFDDLERELTGILSSGSDPSATDVDSIANLALLDGGDNSALNNSVFAVKRTKILARDREGSYIPPCTRNVFLKYYAPSDEHQMHFWSADDRAYYLDAVVAAVRGYLLPDEVIE